tara:strand:- start:656 stop:1876 length:1221 start_codon:yes stop_codon:yes gene_type:complete
MGLGNSRNISVGSNQSIGTRSKDKSNVGVVFKVILDIDDELLDIKEIPDGEKSKYIGAIQYRLQSSNEKNENELPIAIPYNSVFTSLPVKNEVVRIITVDGVGLQYERVSTSPTPNVSGDSNIISKSYTKDKGPSGSKSSDYTKVQTTGISRSKQSDSESNDTYGEYFESDLNIHKLKVYEGDSYIESRFGQSIRFSGYNNSENELNPTITIRNGENAESKQSDSPSTTLEDINKDGNIIFLGSGEHLLPYTLPTENTYDSFSTYPSELKGNQIVLNSDRIILSAKAAEMIFVSKKDVGFITDGKFSIDATDGIDVTLEDVTNINTNDNDINLNSGNGKINIGDQNLEPLVKGDTLLKLLTELITAIEVMTHITPSGLSAPPLNVSSFTKIKGELKTMLSNLNTTS